MSLINAFNSGGTHLFATHKTLKGDLPWNRVWFSVVCTQPLFYFSFLSFRKHRRAGERSERASESEGDRGARDSLNGKIAEKVAIVISSAIFASVVDHVINFR